MRLALLVPFMLVLLATEPAGAGPAGGSAPKTERPLEPGPASMVSAIPRWPFIAGFGVVFLIMAALGLRRRR